MPVISVASEKEIYKYINHEYCRGVEAEEEEEGGGGRIVEMSEIGIVFLLFSLRSLRSGESDVVLRFLVTWLGLDWTIPD